MRVRYKIKKKLKSILEYVNVSAKKYEHAIKIIGGFSFIFTLMVNVWTIKEDVATRNSEYKPAIVIDTNYDYKITATWNPDNQDKKAECKASKFVLTNVGNGNAVHVYFIIEKKELEIWKENLKKLNLDYDYDSWNEEERFEVYCPYIIKGVENSQEIELPQGIQECFAEICKWKSISGKDMELPSLDFKIVCHDVQFEPIEYEYRLISEIEQTTASVDYSGEKSSTYSIEIRPARKWIQKIKQLYF